MSDISQQAKSGASWLAISQIIQPVWEFIVGIALARILTPKDFGIVAMGVIFFSLATAISNMGISNVLIQKEKLEQIDIDTSQTIAALSGIIIYFVLIFLSYFINLFFKEPLAADVLRVFSLNFIINGITMIPAALMAKEMRFRIISLIDILSSGIYGVSALFIAYLGYGLWSLVHSVILAALFRCVASCITASYFPKFGWNGKVAVHVIKFGGGLTLASVLNYTARNLDFFVIGKFLGSAQLGLYKRAYDLAVIPKEKVADSLSRVLLPFLCKIREDKAWTKSAFLKTNKTIALICVPVLLFSFLSAPEIINVLYGEQWTGAIKSFQIMSLGGIFYALFAPFGSVLVAYGKTRLYLSVQTIYSLLLLVLTLVGVNYGIEGVSIGVVVSLFIVLNACVYFVKDTITLSTREFIHSLSLPLFIGTTVVSVLMTFKYFLTINDSLTKLFINSVLATLVYVCFLWFYKDDLLEELRISLVGRIVKVRCTLIGHLREKI